MPSKSSGTRASAAAAVDISLLFSTLSKRFLAEQRSGGIWDEQTVRQAEKTCSLAVEIMQDKPLTQYRRIDANAFKSTLQSLPADYGKAALFRKQPITEIIRRDGGRQPPAARLATRTVKRHVSVLSTLFRWAAREGMDVTNPFQGFSFPSARRANQQREMWNVEELKLLFASPVWSGCKSAVHRIAPGTMIIRDDKFWLPLIALFTGMRQEEICQLQTEDIRQIDGYWNFDINARPPRKLKNKNAIRRVPVHPELVALGFLDFIKACKASRHSAVFPDLAPGGADGRLGHSYSKWFARYRQAIGVYKKGLDFHSLRHTATTLLQRAGVAIGTIDELTGHATPGETARYSHGLTMKQLAEAIASIRPEIDLSKLHRVSSLPGVDGG